MKRWSKRLAVVVGILLVLVAACLLVEHVRGKRALTHRVTELSASGERLALSELLPPRVPAHDNAAVELNQLTNARAAILTNHEHAPPSLRFAVPGKAVVAWKLKEWTRDRKFTNDWTKVKTLVDQSADVFPLIHTDARKPRLDTEFNYSDGFVDFKLGPIVTLRRVAQALHLATELELSRGHLAAAHTNLVSLIQWTTQQTEPLIIFEMVRQASANYAFNTTWEALQADGWTDSQLAALQAAWARADYVSDLARSVELERAMTLDFYRQITSSSGKRNRFVKQQDALGAPFNQFATHGHVLRYVNLPLWRVAWRDQDELRALNRWQKLIEHERIARTNSWASLKQSETNTQSVGLFNAIFSDEQLPWLERFRFPFSSTAFSLNDNLIRRTLTVQTQKRVAMTALALKRYQLRQGKLPPDLKGLVPELLPELPRDDMDGSILRYRFDGPAGFVLYSVGENGADDGGDPTLLNSGESYRQIWSGRDAVWPVAATPDEAADAMARKE